MVLNRSRHRRILQAIWAGLGLAFILLMISLRVRGEALVPRTVFVLTLLFFLFGGVHLILVYDSWFKQHEWKPIGIFKRIVFVLLVASYIFLLVLSARAFLT
jgi:hypothetical protein